MAFIVSPSPWLAIGTFGIIAAVAMTLRAPSLVVTRSDRLAALDGLRGLLAFGVFVHHFTIFYQYKHIGTWDAPKSPFYTLCGQASVALFFMITGFLFFGKIKAVRGHLDLDRFFFGRVFRIVPLYAVSLAALYGLALVQAHRWPDASLADSLDRFLFFQQAHLLSFENSAVVNAGVQWTLAYEWLFYFSIPIVAWAWRRLGLRSWPVFLLAAVTLVLAFKPVGFGAGLFSTASLAPFALGGLVAECARVEAIRGLARSAWGVALVVAAACLLLVVYRTAYSPSAYLVLTAVFAPIAMGNALFGLLRTRIMLLLGEISYDLYLLHGLVLFTLFDLVMPDAMLRAHTSGRLFALMLMAGLSAVVVSLLAHRAIERPCMRIGGRLAATDRAQWLAAP